MSCDFPTNRGPARGPARGHGKEKTVYRLFLRVRARALFFARTYGGARTIRRRRRRHPAAPYNFPVPDTVTLQAFRSSRIYVPSTSKISKL